MKILFGMPTAYGKIEAEAWHSITNASKNHEVEVVFMKSSFVTYNFNRLWCEALNRRKDGLTHFCLVHADLQIEHFFLDKMITIMEKNEADILGAVIPLKNTSGKTSTAVDLARDLTDQNYDPDEDRFRIAAMSLKDVYKMPPTFTGPKLLVNSGVMLVDFRKPWVEQICFTFHDWILKRSTGEFIAKSIPEDWQMCRDARKLGAKIYATREIAVIHHGAGAFPNTGAWGD